MAEPTSVSLEGMKAAQGNFQTAVEEANSSYSQMESQIRTLEASWTGDAASTYTGAMDQWLQDFSTVKQQLNLMLEKLQANTGTYTTTHSNTTDVAGQLKNSMASPLPGF